MVELQGATTTAHILPFRKLLLQSSGPVWEAI
jgi:hypothetical protein